MIRMNWTSGRQAERAGAAPRFRKEPLVVPSSVENSKAIGGYLEMEIVRGGRELYPQAMALQSARAAFLALLLAGKPRRIWMPWYICDTMTDQLPMAGVEIMRYGLDENFAVANDVELARTDWLLYVNYFGLCEPQADALLRRFDPRQVIIDNSHALFSPPRSCLAVLYSPRKFVGVPDGGYLIAGIDVPPPQTEDTGSVRRCLPLLTRAADCAESGYADFLEAQATLSNQMPLRMSRLTSGLLGAIDYADVARRRRENFDHLGSLLGSSNRCTLRMRPGDVPLSYPYVGGGPALRKHLIARRIYVPQFWPHLVDPDLPVPEFERFLANEYVPLPCDQRYDFADMDHVAVHVKQNGAF
jgi:hypothetical protein